MFTHNDYVCRNTKTIRICFYYLRKSANTYTEKYIEMSNGQVDWNIDHSKHYCHNEMSYFNYLGNVQNATHASRVCVTN